MAIRRAGLRRHAIELQRPVRTRTPTGFSDAWVTYARAWASVSPVTASQVERTVSNTLQVPISHLVEMDYRPDVSTTDRVRHVDRGGTHLLYVQGLQDPDMRNIALQLACEERAT